MREVLTDGPCTCGIDPLCDADAHLVTTERAAAILGIGERSVRQAVSRGKLRAAGRDYYGYVFEVSALDEYAATRGTCPIAQRDRATVPSACR